MPDSEPSQLLVETSGPPVVLVVSEEPADQAYVAKLLNKLDYSLLNACNCEEALHHLARRNIAAVLSDAVLPDGDWRSILAILQSSEPAPRLVVTSRFADDRLWAEVLNLGGYDVVAKPFRPDEIARVLGMACSRPSLGGHSAAASTGSDGGSVAQCNGG